MWALRHARLNGMKAHFVLASLNESQFNGRPILHAYAKARTACCDDELNGLRLDASTRLRENFSQILSTNQQVMAVIDVPADAFEVKQTVTILGMRAEVPNGLMRLAVARQLPVTLFSTAIDFNTGERTLQIKQLGVFQDVDTLANEAFAYLDEDIKASPPSWHFWSEASRFFKTQGQ